MTRRRLTRVFWPGAAAIVAAPALISLVAVLRGGFSQTDGRILGTLGWILAALAFFLAPVLQRWSAVGGTEAGDRVLGTLDDVEVVATRRPGDELVVSDRPRGGERLVLRHRR